MSQDQKSCLRTKRRQSSMQLTNKVVTATTIVAFGIIAAAIIGLI